MKFKYYTSDSKKGLGLPDVAKRPSLALLAFLLVLANSLACSKKQATQETSAEKPGESGNPPPPTQGYVNTISDLPPCDETRRGYLYYIADLRKFQSCDGKSWQAVEISSDSGSGGLERASLGSLNDLWKFNGTNWTWVAGSNGTNQPGTYGTKGVASPTNFPGARSGSASWLDTSGNLWLFGGGNHYNDLWKISP